VRLLRACGVLVSGVVVAGVIVGCGKGEPTQPKAEGGPKAQDQKKLPPAPATGPMAEMEAQIAAFMATFKEVLQTPVTEADVKMVIAVLKDLKAAGQDVPKPDMKPTGPDAKAFNLDEAAAQLESVPEVKTVLDRHGVTGKQFMSKALPTMMAAQMSASGKTPAMLQQDIAKVEQEIAAQMSSGDSGDGAGMGAAFAKMMLPMLKVMLGVMTSIPPETVNVVKPHAAELMQLGGGPDGPRPPVGSGSGSVSVPPTGG